MRIARSNVRDGSIDINQYNGLVDSANAQQQTDSTIDVVSGQFSANIPTIEDRGWEAYPYSGNIVKIKLGSLIAGRDSLLCSVDESSDYYINHFESLNNTGLEFGDWVLLSIPDTKFSVSDTASAPLSGGQTYVDGATRPLYLVVGYFRDTTITGGVSDIEDATPFSACLHPSVFVTNNTAFTLDNDSEEKNDRWIRNQYKTIAKIEIYADGSIKSIEQLHTGDIHLNKDNFDGENPEMMFNGFDLAFDLPQYVTSTELGLAKRESISEVPDGHWDSGHKQIHGLDKVNKDSYSVPFFKSNEDYQSIYSVNEVGGEMEFAALDSHLLVSDNTSTSSGFYQKTFEVVDVDSTLVQAGRSTKVQQLYGISGVDDHQPSVPFYDSPEAGTGGPNGELKYWYLDDMIGDPTRYTAYSGPARENAVSLPDMPRIFEYVSYDGKYALSLRDAVSKPTGTFTTGDKYLALGDRDGRPTLVYLDSPTPTIYELSADGGLTIDTTTYQPDTATSNISIDTTWLSDWIEDQSTTMFAGEGITIKDADGYDVNEWNPLDLASGNVTILTDFQEYSHHSLVAFDSSTMDVGEGWSTYDDHGSTNKFTGIGDYPLMITGDAGGKTPAEMYVRNAGPNYIGGTLSIETGLDVADTSLYADINNFSVDVTANANLIAGVDINLTAGNDANVTVDSYLEMKAGLAIGLASEIIGLSAVESVTSSILLEARNVIDIGGENGVNISSFSGPITITTTNFDVAANGDVDAEGFINTNDIFKVGDVDGATQTSQRARLLLEDGTYLSVYIRGGIITLT